MRYNKTAKDTEDLINVLKKICSEGDNNGK